jgi:[ribosomal protein S18]-alanine N-acetyltransferase
VAVESTRERGITLVRRFRSEDADSVMVISAESPKAANWSRESYIELAAANQLLLLVIETNGELSGFLVGRCIGDQAEVLNLAVKHKDKRKGAGTALMAAALEDFASHGATSVYLEVRESNTSAIAFYERHGFAKSGKRNGYYRRPDEPAVIMIKKLSA